MIGTPSGTQKVLARTVDDFVYSKYDPGTDCQCEGILGTYGISKVVSHGTDTACTPIAAGFFLNALILWTARFIEILCSFDLFMVY